MINFVRKCRTRHSVCSLLFISFRKNNQHGIYKDWYVHKLSTYEFHDVKLKSENDKKSNEIIQMI